MDLDTSIMIIIRLEILVAVAVEDCAFARVEFAEQGIGKFA